MLLLSLFLFTVCTFSTTLKSPNFFGYEKMFNAWKLEHNKVYKTAEENLQRFINFLQSYHRILEKSKNSNGVRYGLNKFSDLSVEEFKQTRLMPTLKPKKHTVLASNLNPPPKAFDWRNKGMITPVKHQGSCGSCWAFSATETIESAWMLKYGLNNVTMQPLSEQQIVDCDWSDFGCWGGEPEGAYAYIMSAGGQETNATYPYDHASKENIWCEFDASKIYAKVLNWSYACSQGDETTLLSNAFHNGPTSICVDASDWSDYNGGILLASDCGSDLDHCVQVVGWDLTGSTPYWIVRNSWGTDWGENGFIRLQYGQDTCGLTQEATNVFAA